MLHILTISCPDRVGLVHDITAWFKANNHNIVELDQYVDRHQDRFFMRIEFEMLTPDTEKLASWLATINHNTEWQLHARSEKVRAAIFVTHESHCLLDLLSRSIDGELQIEVPLIISNHDHLSYIAERFRIPFHHIPVTAGNKSGAEASQLKLLSEAGIDLVILAKYMQILSSGFVNTWQNRIINIHHSFLPAFPGAKPYHSAYHRGVKIIGATSHFVTEDLDAGPIIEQDVIRIRHTDSIDDLKRKGKEVEKNVLSRAVWNFADRRIITHANKTIIL